MVPSLQSSWYLALYEENCVPVLELLKDNPQLLMQGWNEDPKRVVEGRYLKRGRWKGRTALHVGARRGSAELVKHVIGMFDDEGWSPRFSLEDLLTAKDGEYKLDALAMAVVNGNREIILMLARASILKCESNPYEILNEWNLSDAIVVTTTFEDDRHQLRRITEDVMEELTNSRSADAEMLKTMYTESRDFNFLPWEEYLFHSTFLRRSMHMVQHLDDFRHGIFARATSPSLRRFLCELQDRQGRTALHVAVDEGTVQQYLVLMPRGKDSADFLTAPDGAGRTPLHRAAAKRNLDSMRHLIGDNRIDLNERFYPWEYAESLWTDLGIDVEKLSKRNGCNGFGWFDVYDNSTAFHAAIIHRSRECVRQFLDDKHNTNRHEDYVLDLEIPFTRLLQLQSGELKRCALEPLQLAALVGDAAILGMLLEEVSARDPGRPSSWPRTCQCSLENPWSAGHLVAASGKFELLKLVMDSKYYNPLVEDLDKNTLLHHATKGREVLFDTHLIDHISCPHVGESRLDDGGQEAVRKGHVERHGCIELLLQAGFDIWKTNKAEQAPYPGPDATAEVLSWWYERLSKETILLQNTLNAAANAISVTATLVATASYVGPLQPPLGFVLRNNGTSTVNFLEVTSLSVRIFIVCDTLSFYLAVASIMLALIPSLPMPQESMIDELRRTRTMVTLAVGFLFPSIISVLVAFAAASIAVVPNNGSWNHGGLTLTTASVGGLICLGVILLFSIRLLRLVFYKNVRIRGLFRATAF